MRKEIKSVVEAKDLILAEGREGYGEMIRVLALAYQQSAFGKGEDRHGNGNDFLQQPIFTEGLMLGTGAAAFQVSKKSKEAHRLAADGRFAQAKEDILGAIVYAVSEYLIVEHMEAISKK